MARKLDREKYLRGLRKLPKGQQHRAAYRKKYDIRPSGKAKGKSKGGSSSRPFDVTQPLTRQELDRQVNAGVNAEYGQQLGQLKGQIGQIPSLFDQYRNNLTQYQQNTEQAYQRAQQGAQGVGQGIQDRATQQIGDIQKREQEDAARRGASYNPNSLAQFSQAATSNANQGAAYAAQIGSQGANASDYYNKIKALTHQQQIGQGNLAQARLRQTQQLAGASGSKLRNQLVQDERQYRLNALLATQKGTYQEAQTALGQGRLQATVRGQNLTKRGQDISHKDRVRGQDITKRGQDKSGGKKGKSNSTPVERRGNRRKWTSILGVVDGERKGTLKKDPFSGKVQGVPQPGDENYELYVIGRHFRGNKNKFLPGDKRRLKRNWPGIL